VRPSACAATVGARILVETRADIARILAILLIAIGVGAAVGQAATGARVPVLAEPRPVPDGRVAHAARPALAALTRSHPGRPSVQPHTAARATISLYERTDDPTVLRQQGCHAARRGVSGIVILDFGKPAWNGRTYGTILFSGRFAANASVTTAMLGYARGWVTCGGAGSGRIVLARGTSNYHINVPNAFHAGWMWAHETAALDRRLAAAGLAAHVSAAAADDVEPAWDRSFSRTFDFYRGFRGGSLGHLIYDFGSLDGGAGGVWTAQQAFYVSSGMRYARAIPEIYTHAMARQWAHLTRYALERYHRPVRFAGLMTQHAGNPRNGFGPREAHTALVRALVAHVGRLAPPVPRTLTDIRQPS